jgi:putative SOS response-associated peptidase YedK
VEEVAKEVPARFNARAEAVAAKPMFRTAFKERRCIVPASGFFEWTGEKGAKQPHLFTAADGSLLLALRRPLGPLERSPHRRMGSLLHNHRSGAPVWIEPSHDRMPVLPEMTDFDGWLDGSLGLEAPSRHRKEPCASGRCRRGTIAPASATTIRPIERQA